MPAQLQRDINESMLKDIKLYEFQFKKATMSLVGLLDHLEGREDVKQAIRSGFIHLAESVGTMLPNVLKVPQEL